MRMNQRSEIRNQRSGGFFSVVLFFLLALNASAAITEHYITSTGTDTWANSTSSSTPCSLTTALTNAAAGDRVNIKNDATYTRTATDTPTNAGTITSPIIWRGYSSTIGDADLGRTNGNGPLITTNMPTLSYNSTFGFSPTAFNLFEGLNITTSNNAASINEGNNAGSVVRLCNISNASTGASAAGVTVGTAVAGAVLNSDITLTGASGGAAAVNLGAAAGFRVVGNRIKGGPTTGVKITSSATGVLIAFNTIFSQTGNAISTIDTTATAHVLFNTIVGGGADGVNFVTGSSRMQFIYGNMFTDNTGDGVDMVSTSNGVVIAYNRTRDNGSAIANGGDWVTATNWNQVTTDTGGPETDYTNSGSNDYRLIQASPAKGVGQPLYLDLGAVQRQEPAGNVIVSDDE